MRTAIVPDSALDALIPDGPTPDGPAPDGPTPEAAPIGLDSLALTPIVGTHSGRTLGVRPVLAGGPPVPPADADPDDLLAWQTALHEVLVRLFARVPDRGALKLFLPVYPGTLDAVETVVAKTAALARAHEVTAASLMPVVSAADLPAGVMTDLVEAEGSQSGRVVEWLDRLRALSGRLALSAVGTGHAGLPLMALVRPDIIVLDAFFVRGIATDRPRRLIVGRLTDLVHTLGGTVVADGVDTRQTHRLCRQAGCDYIEGAFAGAPVTDPDHLARDHDAIREATESDQRAAIGDAALITAQTVKLDPIPLGTHMDSVFERFRFDKDYNFFPVVDQTGEPVGIIREIDLKDYTYSLYGKDLLSNRALGRRLDGFVVPAPIATVDSKAEKILEIFSAANGAECVLITRDRQYVGFLSAASLLKVVNEKNLALARDQNPLSRLPGNSMINEFIAAALQDSDHTIFLVYMDFDNFKPFNDTYGYRQGDRAITLFADLMRKVLPPNEAFIGHVGGDDFFAGLRGLDRKQVMTAVAELVETFRVDVESFYDEATRAAGFIVAKDRLGVERRMPLLAVSAAVVELVPGHAVRSLDEIAELIAALKKQAKAAPDRIASALAT